MQEPADLGASIAQLGVRLARLYLEEARMSHSDPETGARDKSRAESLFRWASEAAETTNASGQELLHAALGELKAELDSFELAKGVHAC